MLADGAVNLGYKDPMRGQTVQRRKFNDIGPGCDQGIMTKLCHLHQLQHELDLGCSLFRRPQQKQGRGFGRK